MSDSDIQHCYHKEPQQPVFGCKSTRTLKGYVIRLIESGESGYPLSQRILSKSLPVLMWYISGILQGSF